MSDHLSVASFAFKGSDQIKPKPRARPAKSSAPPNPGNDRSSGGYVASDAANAKFANRLRSTDDGDNTMRPTSRTRKSLLPAMALTAANGKADVAQHGRTTPVTKRPWNASTVPIKARASPSVRKATAAPQPVTMDGKRIRGQLAPSPSGNSGVAGLWTADQDREAPRKRTEPVLAGGQFGGRI